MAKVKEKKTNKEKKKRIGKSKKVYTIEKIMLEMQDLAKNPGETFTEISRSEFKLKALDKLANIALKNEQNKLLGNGNNEPLKEIKLTFVDSKTTGSSEERIKKLDDEIKRGIENGD